MVLMVLIVLIVLMVLMVLTVGTIIGASNTSSRYNLWTSPWILIEILHSKRESDGILCGYVERLDLHVSELSIGRDPLRQSTMLAPPLPLARVV